MLSFFILAVFLPQRIKAQADPGFGFHPVGTAKPRLERGSVVAEVEFSQLAMPVNAPSIDTPQISIWHGEGVAFGAGGTPSPFVNITGHVSPADRILSLVYSLNEANFDPLAIGPQPAAPPTGPRRLYTPGEFNIEIPYARLTTGTNTINIRATDLDGNQTERQVSFMVVSSQPPLLPVTLMWNQVEAPDHIAQVIDGHWQIHGDAVRPVHFGYDRLIAVGDVSWDDYEVTVPLVLNSLPRRTDLGGAINNAYTSPSNGPGVGLILRWPGHYSENGEQPGVGWTNLGAIGWFHYGSAAQESIVGALELMTVQNGYHIRSQPSKVMGTAEPYVLKMQVTTSEGIPKYRLKAWPQIENEPLQWDIDTENDPQGAGLIENRPANGSVLLVAHHVDAAFGPVLIAPVGYQPRLTIVSEAGGTVASVDRPYNFYASVTVEAHPETGYAFGSWHGTHDTASNPLTFRVLGDTALTARFVKPIPLPALDEHGTFQDGRQTHTDHIAFSFPPAQGDATLAFDAWDVDTDNEIGVYLNGTFVTYVPHDVQAANAHLPDIDNEWERHSVTLLDALIDDSGDNILVFHNARSQTGAAFWGIRDVQVTASGVAAAMPVQSIFLPLIPRADYSD